VQHLWSRELRTGSKVVSRATEIKCMHFSKSEATSVVVGIWTGLGWPRIETGGGRL